MVDTGRQRMQADEMIARRQPDGDYLPIMETDGANVHSMPVGDLLYSSLSWSPDGQRIAFNRFFEGLEDIYLLDIASGKFVACPTPVRGASPPGCLNAASDLWPVGVQAAEKD